MNRTIGLILSKALPLVCCLLLVVLTSCNDNSKKISSLHRTIDLEQEKSQSLSQELDVLKGKINNQQQIINNLRKMGPDRLSKLFTVSKIKLSRYTGGVDTDKKTGHDEIKIIFIPIDDKGHAIKAAGEINIRLFDLAAKPKETMLAEYNYPVEKVSEYWSGGFMTNNYSFSCPIGKKNLSSDQVTVRISFRDYLTGKTFTAQKACKIVLPLQPE